MAKPIPEGLHMVTVAMSVDGCAEAIEVYKKAFGAVELPGRAPDPSGKKIWHTAIKIGDTTIFMNDAFPEMGGGANTTRLWVYGGEVDGAFKRALDAGLKVKMPLADMFWGDRLGTVVDKWGNEWTIAQHMKDMTPEEQNKAAQDFIKQMPSKK